MEETNVNVEMNEEETNFDDEMWAEESLFETDDIDEVNEEDGQLKELTEDRVDHDANKIAANARKEAMLTINQQAQARGFNSVEEMFAAFSAQQEEDLATMAESGDEKHVKALEEYKAHMELEHIIAVQKERENTSLKVQKYIEEFNNEYPQHKISSLAEIKALPNGEKIANLLAGMDVGKLSLTDAFLIANKADVLKGKLQAAKQAAINNINSKSHLQSTKNNGGGEIINIPPAILRDYMAYGLTKEEAVTDYKLNFKER